MKKLIFMMLLSVTALSARADSDSDRILKEMTARLSALGSYQTTFTAKAEGMAVSGDIAVSGERFRISTEDMTILGDASVRYEINHANEEVYIDRVDPADRSILSNPVAAFDLRDRYSHIYKGEQGGNVVVELRPFDKYSAVGMISLSIDKSTGLPVTISYSGGSGEAVVVSVGRFVKKSIPAAELSFNRAAYPGYEFFDFR